MCVCVCVPTFPVQLKNDMLFADILHLQERNITNYSNGSTDNFIEPAMMSVFTKTVTNSVYTMHYPADHSIFSLCSISYYIIQQTDLATLKPHLHWMMSLCFSCMTGSVSKTAALVQHIPLHCSLCTVLMASCTKLTKKQLFINGRWFSMLARSPQTRYNARLYSC